MADRPKLMGVNHVALEVDDIEAALAFWEALFEFELRGRGEGMAFLDMGDQFIALSEVEGAGRSRDAHRHFGLVVSHREGLKYRARAAGAEVLETKGCDIIDPWGNWLQVVDYAEVQFAKTAGALRVLGHDGAKSEDARKQIADKGMA